MNVYPENLKKLEAKTQNLDSLGKAITAINLAHKNSKSFEKQEWNINKLFTIKNLRIPNF